MFINFKQLRKLGWDVREVDDGVVIEGTGALDCVGQLYNGLINETKLDMMEVERIVDELHHDVQLAMIVRDLRLPIVRTTEMPRETSKKAK